MYHMYAGPHKGQKKAWDSLMLQLWCELPSVGTESALHHLAISPAPSFAIVDDSEVAGVLRHSSIDHDSPKITAPLVPDGYLDSPCAHRQPC